jgi:hypothetical protein
MKVEVVKMVRYYPDGFTLVIHHAGEVVDIADDFARGMIERGKVSPIADRETKPEIEPIEVKSNTSAKRGTRKPRRTKVKPTDN